MGVVGVDLEKKEIIMRKRKGKYKWKDRKDIKNAREREMVVVFESGLIIYRSQWNKGIN